jgi:hypothetical protein
MVESFYTTVPALEAMRGHRSAWKTRQRGMRQRNAASKAGVRTHQGRRITKAKTDGAFAAHSVCARISSAPPPPPPPGSLCHQLLSLASPLLSLLLSYISSVPGSTRRRRRRRRHTRARAVDPTHAFLGDGTRDGRALHLALGVHNDARVVLKVEEDAVASAPRLALAHHHGGHDWVCGRPSEQCGQQGVRESTL